MQCNVLFSHVKNCALKIILDALFEFKSKDKYERKMINRLKRNFKRKIYKQLLLNVTSLILLWSQHMNGKTMKKKSWLKM